MIEDDEFTGEFNQGRANPARYGHLIFRVEAFDGKSGEMVKGVEWWDPNTPTQLAMTAFALSQLIYAMNDEAPKAAAVAA